MGAPKIVVIGAGSYFFGRTVIHKVTQSPVLRGGTLALVDIEPKVLDTMMGIGRRVIAETGAPTNLIGATDRREVLKDADFVVLTFSKRNAYYRGIDCEVAAKYGVRLCSADTIGPGGVFRALREVPTALAVAADVEKITPKAWIINLVNPTSVLGIALMRYARGVRSFAICDSLHEPDSRLRMLKTIGVLPSEAQAVPPQVEQKLDLAIGGVNHFTWITRFNYDGQDLLPRWREDVAKRAAAETQKSDSKAQFNANYELDLMDVYGAFPAVIAHTKEYVPFYQGYGVTPVKPKPLAIFDAKAREREMQRHMEENEAYASGAKPIAELIAEGSSDHANDIIEQMWGGLGKSFYVNTANRGAVTNMADDAFLELRCDVDMHGPRPQPFGELPRGVLGLTQQVLDVHELTAAAGATFDRKLVLKALASDPIVNNLGDCRAIIDELFEREKDVLDARWYG